MFNSLRPHGMQHTRLPCPSTTPRACSNSSIKSVTPSNHLILYHPLLLLPSIFPNIRVFSNESALHIKCPKYWNFSFNISSSDEHPELISFRMGWLDFLAVQEFSRITTTSQFKSIHSSVLKFLYTPPIYSRRSSKEAVMLTALEGVHMG